MRDLRARRCFGLLLVLVLMLGAESGSGPWRVDPKSQVLEHLPARLSFPLNVGSLTRESHTFGQNPYTPEAASVSYGVPGQAVVVVTIVPNREDPAGTAEKLFAARTFLFRSQRADAAPVDLSPITSSQGGDTGAGAANALTPKQRQAPFDEALAGARADDQISNDFRVGFVNEFAAATLNADGTVDTSTLRMFSTAEGATNYAKVVGGVSINGLGGQPARVFAGAITSQRMLNLFGPNLRAINFGSPAGGARFTILHEFQHFQGVPAGPIGERIANRNALRPMGINF